MRSGLICACLLIAALAFPARTAWAAAGDMDLEAQLIWGTNDLKPDSKLKPAGPNLSGKLRNSPFKWDHYFEVHRETFTLKVNEEKTITMSKNCDIKVMNLGDEQIKFQLIGKGKLANTVSQALPKGQLLVTGGDAENSTAWFVALKRVD